MPLSDYAALLFDFTPPPLPPPTTPPDRISEPTIRGVATGATITASEQGSVSGAKSRPIR